MLAFYIRSSSIGTYKVCEQQFFLRYVLGMREPSNKKADIGSAVHKVLEGIALVNLAKKEGRDYINDPECFGKLTLLECTLNRFIDLAFQHYKESNPHHYWGNADKELIKECVVAVLEGWGGTYHPIRRNIWATEFHFDFEIEEDWGKFEYEVRGQKIEGRLRIKGTVDLITEVTNELGTYYEVIDYKSGAKRIDWADGKEKDLDAFYQDHQLRLYYYALSKALPGKDFIFTLIYMRDGGPFTVSYEPSEIPVIEEYIKNHYMDILNLEMPSLRNDFFCDRVCHFGKTRQPGTDLTICQYFHEELKTHGIKRVVDDHIDLKAVATYSGGGKTLTEDGERVTKH